MTINTSVIELFMVNFIRNVLETRFIALTIELAQGPHFQSNLIKYGLHLIKLHVICRVLYSSSVSVYSLNKHWNLEYALFTISIVTISAHSRTTFSFSEISSSKGWTSIEKSLKILESFVLTKLIFILEERLSRHSLEPRFVPGFEASKYCFALLTKAKPLHTSSA